MYLKMINERSTILNIPVAINQTTLDPMDFQKVRGALDKIMKYVSIPKKIELRVSLRGTTATEESLAVLEEPVVIVEDLKAIKKPLDAEILRHLLHQSGSIIKFPMGFLIALANVTTPTELKNFYYVTDIKGLHKHCTHMGAVDYAGRASLEHYQTKQNTKGAIHTHSSVFLSMYEMISGTHEDLKKLLLSIVSSGDIKGVDRANYTVSTVQREYMYVIPLPHCEFDLAIDDEENRQMYIYKRIKEWYNTIMKSSLYVVPEIENQKVIKFSTQFVEEDVRQNSVSKYAVVNNCLNSISFWIGFIKIPKISEKLQFFFQTFHELKDIRIHIYDSVIPHRNQTSETSRGRGGLGRGARPQSPTLIERSRSQQIEQSSERPSDNYQSTSRGGRGRGRGQAQAARSRPSDSDDDTPPIVVRETTGWRKAIR